MSRTCIYAEGEGFDFVETKLVRARKPHECCECRETINVGDLHEHLRGVYDGQWDSYRTCARCVNVAADYFHGRTLGCMVEDFLAEHDVDYRKGIPAHITPCRSAA